MNSNRLVVNYTSLIIKGFLNIANISHHKLPERL